MELHILNSKEKKNLSKLIKKQFDCDFTFNYEVFMNTKNKIFILNKDVSKIELDELRINSLGLYFGELSRDELTLTIESSQIIGPIAKNNVLKLDYDQAKNWMKGEDFDIDTKLEGFVIIKNKDDFLGCGRIVNNKLLNYVPKERRT